jgi:hypothetical protein
MTQALTFDIARPWRTHPRETVGLGLLGLVGAIALAGAAGSTNRLPSEGVRQALPSKLPAATDIRPVDPQTAFEINSKLPFATGPNPAAAPFRFAAATGESREHALECLTSAIYYEAGQEPLTGQQAVAQVVLNRVRHPAFPASVCGVVYQGSTRQTGCQFTFTCDGSLARAPERSSWNRAREVAKAALAGFVQPRVGNATHYHANYVVPYWASSLTKAAVEGAHIFYRWAGGWGRPPAFTDRWTANEGDPKALRLAALNAPRPTEPEVQTAETTVEKLEEAGAKVIEGKDGRVRLLFTPEARELVEKVKVVPYVDRSAASENLRFALNGGSSGSPDRPFGREPEGAGTSPVKDGAASSTAQ